MLLASWASRGGGPSQRVGTADVPRPSPAPPRDWPLIPTADQVVFHATWGAGGQQLGRDEQGRVVRFPGPIAVAPDERRVYVADSANGRVVRIDAAAGRIDRAYALPGVREMAVDPSTGELYTLSDGGALDATTPGGATRRVMTAATDEDAEMNLRAVDGPPADVGVYGVALNGARGLFRLSGGPAASLPGWPVGGSYMGVGLEGTTMTAVARDRRGDMLDQAVLTPQKGFPERFEAVGGLFRVLVSENSSDGRPARMLLFVADGRPAVGGLRRRGGRPPPLPGHGGGRRVGRDHTSEPWPTGQCRCYGAGTQTLNPAPLGVPVGRPP